MERIAQRMLDYLQEPWELLSWSLPWRERNQPAVCQLVSPTEIMMIVSLETQMADVLGMINICIPFLVLEPILDKLNVHYYYSSSSQKATQENIDSIRNKLQNTIVPVKVILGTTSITVRELLELNVGDVVPLERNIKNDLEVVIGQRTKFLGKPGVYENRMSVQVSYIVEEGNEDE